MLYTKWLLKVEGREEDQKLLGEGQLRRSETKQGGKAGKKPKQLHKTEIVGQTAWRPYAPTGTLRHDDDEKCWHWTKSTKRVMRKHVKMRGQSKWKNRFVVTCSLKSWWKKNEKWEFWGGGGGEVKFFIIYCKWKKEMEKPVNVRNVERSLLKRVVDDVMRLLVFLTPKISVKSEAYNPEAYNSVPMLVFFWEPIKIYVLI